MPKKEANPRARLLAGTLLSLLEVRGDVLSSPRKAWRVENQGRAPEGRAESRPTPLSLLLLDGPRGVPRRPRSQL